MPERFFYLIGAVIGLSLIMSWSSQRKKAKAWRGVVKDIRHQRSNAVSDNDRLPNDWVTILYHTDAGKKGKIKLRHQYFRQSYPDLRIGDRLVKSPGEYLAAKELPSEQTDDPVTS